MTIPQEVVIPDSSVTEGLLLNVQLLPDGTLLELALVRAETDESLTVLEADARTEQFAREVVKTQDGQWYVYQHCRPTEQVQALLHLLNDHRLMIMFPVRFDGEAGLTVEIIGSESDVQSGFDELPSEIRRRTSIEQVAEYSPRAAGVVSVLTERQREVLNTAAAVGYYDVPRQGTADDVANAVGCAPSTASEHLRKVEARILSALAVG